jgi:hypothetical protein
MNEFLRREEELPQIATDPIEKNNFTIERLTKITPENLDEIYALESACYPPDMMETKEELQDSLESQGAICIAVRDLEGRMFGHVSCVDHNEEYEFMRENDPGFKKLENALHIETIDILPGKNDLKTLIALWDSLKDEAAASGYKKLTMYARADKLSGILQKKGGAKFFRRMPNWYDMGEDFDYLEMDLPEK